MSHIQELQLKSNRLPVKLGIIVPSTFEHSKHLKNKQFLKRVDSEARWFSSHFGGDTEFRTVGDYLDNKKLIREKGVLIESRTNVNTYNKTKKELANHIKQRQKQWGQDTIGYEVAEGFFIYPKRPYISHEAKHKNIKFY